MGSCRDLEAVKHGLEALHTWLPRSKCRHVLVSYLNNCVPPQKLCLYTWGSMPAVGVRSTEASVAEKVRAHLWQCNACPNLHTALYTSSAGTDDAHCKCQTRMRSWRPACAPGLCLAHCEVRGQADGTCKTVLHAGCGSVRGAGADRSRRGGYPCYCINSLAGPMIASTLD